MVMKTILTDLSVSLAEFKKNPNEVLRKSGGRPVAVLSYNKPAFYVMPPEHYAAMLEELNDLQLVRVAKERLKQKGCAVEATLDGLLSGITGSSLHKPVDTGAPVGKEVW